MIDLRSDTITRPTPEMLHTMMEAKVGDDVFGEDETVNAFQEKVAKMFGMEAGLFVPSGTMSNQLGVKVLTQPGDEILIDEKGHIFNYETGASAVLSGIQVRTLKGKDGKLNVDILKHTKRGHYDWEPRTKVICLENSTNKGGGVCYTKQELSDIKGFADDEELLVHLDGARIWNAITATDIKPEFFGKISDTISVCFSKGLGAPVGSMLLSSNERIKKARRFRKMWGGGMRQVGLLAAAADFAIEHNWEKMEDDHRRTKEVAQVIFDSKHLAVDINKLQTNILLFDTVDDTAEVVLEKLKEKGVLMTQFGHQTIRATFHFEITDDDVVKVKEALAAIGE